MGVTLLSQPKIVLTFAEKQRGDKKSPSNLKFNGAT